MIKKAFCFIYSFLICATAFNFTCYAEDYPKSESRYFSEGDYFIYHVGDEFENRTKCFVECTVTVLNDDGKEVNFVDVYDITESFISSYSEGTILTTPGEYTNTLNGENGLLRTTFYVYDYGDMNGDYEVTVQDEIMLYRLMIQDADGINMIRENADVNCDGFIDLLDIREINARL